jgi:hypothetical protein
MLIPSDGNRNSNEEKISFSKSDGWKFPEGTVFVKHFALPLSLDDPDKLQ